MQITLQLFGAFRKFGEELKLSLPENALISDARQALQEKLVELNSDANRIKLIDVSRFATEREILSEKTALQEDAIITIIPPVSGG